MYRKKQERYIFNLNVTQTNVSYIQWSLHNPKDNIYDFDGIANIADVMEAAKEAGLYVILRPGPYICAEIDNGGIPFWLFNKYPGINMRVSDTSKNKRGEKTA